MVPSLASVSQAAGDYRNVSRTFTVPMNRHSLGNTGARGAGTPLLMVPSLDEPSASHPTHQIAISRLTRVGAVTAIAVSMSDLALLLSALLVKRVSPSSLRQPYQRDAGTDNARITDCRNSIHL